MRVLGRLGTESRAARERVGTTALTVAQAARVSEPTISRFENGRGVRHLERIVEAYEHECGLPDGELWRRAIG